MRATAQILIAAMALLVGNSAALATDRSINLTATVPSFCKIAGDINNTVDGTTLDWTSELTTGVFAAAPTAKAATTVNVVCNKASDVALIATKGGMTDAAVTAAAGFDDIIRYKADTTGFAAITGTVTTGTSAGAATANESIGTGTNPNPGAGNISITVTPSATANPLLPGTYTDTLIVRITPQ